MKYVRCCLIDRDGSCICCRICLFLSDVYLLYKSVFFDSFMWPWQLSFTIESVVTMLYNNCTNPSFSLASTNALKEPGSCGTCVICRVALKAPRGDLSTPYRFVTKQSVITLRVMRHPNWLLPQVHFISTIHLHIRYESLRRTPSSFCVVTSFRNPTFISDLQMPSI